MLNMVNSVKGVLEHKKRDKESSFINACYPLFIRKIEKKILTTFLVTLHKYRIQALERLNHKHMFNFYPPFSSIFFRIEKKTRTEFFSSPHVEKTKAIKYTPSQKGPITEA